MNENQDHADAEQTLADALTKSKEVLGYAVPVLMRKKPQRTEGSLIHGLSGRNAHLKPQALRDYLSRATSLLQELRPISPTEIELAQRIIDVTWRRDSAIAQLPWDDGTFDAGAFDSGDFDCETFGSTPFGKVYRYYARHSGAIRTLRRRYQGLHQKQLRQRRRPEPREAWAPETSHAYRCYQKLAVLTDRLIAADLLH